MDEREQFGRCEARLLLPERKQNPAEAATALLGWASSIGHAAGVTRLEPPGDSEVDGSGDRDVERDLRSATASSGRRYAGRPSEQQSATAGPHG
jgi:hypothetical protein